MPRCETECGECPDCDAVYILELEAVRDRLRDALSDVIDTISLFRPEPNSIPEYERLLDRCRKALGES